MVKYFAALIVLMSGVTLAQLPEPTEEQFQQMMQNVQKMQACIAKIDQSAIQEFANRGRAMQVQLKALCNSGKRDEAERLAMSFLQEYQDNKELQALKKCGEQMTQFMPDMMSSLVEELNREDTHVCDGY